MSYLKMLGLGARGKLPPAAGLFSTAVISGSSSAPNLRVMIPTTAANNTALEGFGGVPAIRPLETLHNALSLRQLDWFLERVTAAPVVLNAAPKQRSPPNSVGWSGPSSLMSSSGELPSGLSSAGPSSPNSNYAGNSEPGKLTQETSTWRGGKLPQWDGEASTLCAYDALHPLVPHNLAGSSVSGDVTPVSLASELDFNSNEATTGSVTDHDLLSAEGEDDEETLAVGPCESSLKLIKNDLSPQPSSSCVKLEQSLTSTTQATDFFKLTPQLTKENLYKDIPSSSKNYHIETDKNKCKVDNANYLNTLEPLNLQRKDNSKAKSKSDVLNNGSRRYSDSSAQKSSNSQATRFTTTLVAEDLLVPGTTEAATKTKNVETITTMVTKANNASVKPGFSVTDQQ